MNRIKILSCTIGLAIAFISGFSAYSQSRNIQITQQNPIPKTIPYTLEQIAEHGDESSCWTIIRGTVYDLTSWIIHHPGGKAMILGICGKDGTEAFMKQHGDQSRPQQELASFAIGILAK